ncbi:class I SAM-dependent methyltransferase [Burkholderia cepacia]|nr:class I SAM-dependent methyltransferase [Burkholderia cepacia]
MESQFDDLPSLYENMAEWPFRRDVEIPNVFATLGDVRNRDILDFGCGNGMYSRWLKKRGADKVVGYDVSEGMLRYARRWEEEDPVGIEFISNLPPESDGQFDIVLAVYVLPYARTVDELRKLCAQMTRPLKPGGRLITLPIHPDYVRDRRYYEPMGLRLAPFGDDVDGGKVQLDLFMGSFSAQVTAYVWSRESLDDALYRAGSSIVQWVEYGRMRDGQHPTVDSSLQAYLDKPHAALLNCVIGAHSVDAAG